MSSRTDLPKSLEDALKATSRAFYLSLSVLPQGAREPISLAYMLARTADTVADAPQISPKLKRRLLEQLKVSLRSPEVRSYEAFREIATEHRGERKLLALLPLLLEAFDRLPWTFRQSIAEVVDTLIEGMLWDQELFGGHRGERPDPQGLSDPEVERYTYLVAGCVGPFWSEICSQTEPGLEHLLEFDNLVVAEEFGRALQYINILRDVPEDQSLGRFYLPSLHSSSFKHVFLRRARRALLALTRAVVYPHFFSPRSWRHRVSVFLPLVIGLRTLELLFSGGGPKLGTRVKVPRWEVFFWLLSAPIWVLSDTGLRWLLSSLIARADKQLTNLEEKSYAD